MAGQRNPQPLNFWYCWVSSPPHSHTAIPQYRIPYYDNHTRKGVQLSLSTDFRNDSIAQSGSIHVHPQHLGILQASDSHHGLDQVGQIIEIEFRFSTTIRVKLLKGKITLRGTETSSHTLLHCYPIIGHSTAGMCIVKPKCRGSTHRILAAVQYTMVVVQHMSKHRSMPSILLLHYTR